MNLYTHTRIHTYIYLYKLTWGQLLAQPTINLYLIEAYCIILGWAVGLVMSPDGQPPVLTACEVIVASTDATFRRRTMRKLIIGDLMQMLMRVHDKKQDIYIYSIYI